MERHTIAPRPDWQKTVERQGLIWHSDGATPYWDESAYYSFSAAEIGTIEEATETLYAMFVEAGEEIVGNAELLDVFGIPAFATRRSRRRGRMNPRR